MMRPEASTRQPLQLAKATVESLIIGGTTDRTTLIRRITEQFGNDLNREEIEKLVDRISNKRSIESKKY